MSLLLDARKKSQQALSAQAGEGSHSGHELGLQPRTDSASRSASHDAPSPDNKTRITGQNLFNAKSHAPSLAFAGINRNLLIALGGTVLFLAAGAGYVWYVISPGSVQPPRSMPAAPLAKPAPATTPLQNNLIPEIVSPKPANIPKPAQAKKPSANTTSPRAHKNNPMHIEQHQDEPIDPLLNNAYHSYRSGKFEQAQQLYREVLKLDSSNTDALLGLAVIAQRLGEDNLAAHYYAKVMALDPRNAVANAGMSALTTDDNRESRLKTLLNEQQNSSSLHFALGNYYAGQARWGEAQLAYSNAYKLEPGNAELAFNLAVSLDRLGQKKSAAEYYQRALQLDPEHHSSFDYAKISQRIEELTGNARSNP
jgi:Flp pilus assembly protein TadD